MEIMKKLDKNDRKLLEESVKPTKKALKSKDNSQLSTALNELSSSFETMLAKVPSDNTMSS
ncbi:MAG: hypothetical protein GX270_13450 [Clostridiaceae bacterium]|jgi:hypothetical protein|nr:hypothetical protein [Clostridiaceae bacterium]